VQNQHLSASATTAASGYPFSSSAGFKAVSRSSTSTNVTLPLSDSTPFPGRDGELLE
jgi:hypothetical protein